MRLLPSMFSKRRHLAASPLLRSPQAISPPATSLKPPTRPATTFFPIITTPKFSRTTPTNFYNHYNENGEDGAGDGNFPRYFFERIPLFSLHQPPTVALFLPHSLPLPFCPSGMSEKQVNDKKTKRATGEKEGITTIEAFHDKRINTKKRKKKMATVRTVKIHHLHDQLAKAVEEKKMHQRMKVVRCVDQKKSLGQSEIKNPLEHLFPVLRGNCHLLKERRREKNCFCYKTRKTYNHAFLR